MTPDAKSKLELLIDESHGGDEGVAWSVVKTLCEALENIESTSPNFRKVGMIDGYINHEAWIALNRAQTEIEKL